MNGQIGFIIKILLVSTLFSFLVKYGGRLLPIEANDFLAITIVLLPSILFSLILWLRHQKKPSIT